MPSMKTPTAMVPSHRVAGEAVVASVSGEVDLSNSDDLRRSLLELVERHAPKKLILNFGAVDYLDSSAIAVLVEVHKALRKVGGKLYLTNLQTRVKGIFRVARLDLIFGLVDDEAAALAK